MLAELIVAGVALAAPATAPALQVTPPPSGAAYGTITVPAIGIRAPIRQLPARGAGKQEHVLADSVGHLPTTYGPGMGGTVALFGHRVTPTLGLSHGPFRYIDRLHRGDRIIVRMPYGRYVYAVKGHRVVRATAWSAFRAKLDGEVLLLAACHPPGSAAFRYVVQATSQPSERS
jgi:sortase A